MSIPRGKSRALPDVSRSGLEAYALAYLDRRDCTVRKLREVLERRVRGSGTAGSVETRAAIEQILERYQASGMLSDERFAARFVEQQRARGASRRLIENKLGARGIGSELASQLLTSQGAASELEAALAYARRRRLGPYRGAEQRAHFRHKDFGALARAGFDLDVVRRVLGAGPEADDPA